MATFDDIRRLCADLPEVTVGTSYGTPGLRVRKKNFCRMWSDREYARDGVDPDDTEVLVVFCELDEKPALIASSGGALFETPHYEGYPAMLIRLADIADDDLLDFLEDSYRLKAPLTLSRRLDEFQKGSDPS